MDDWASINVIDGGHAVFEFFFGSHADMAQNGAGELRCLVPRNRGALYHDLRRDELWGKFFTAAPQRLRRSVEQYKIVKRA